MFDNSTDPVQDIIDGTKRILKKIALTLMDESIIVKPGDRMVIPNRVKTLRIHFERLESEPSPRSTAQKTRRANERARAALIATAVVICATILVAHHPVR